MPRLLPCTCPHYNVPDARPLLPGECPRHSPPWPKRKAHGDCYPAAEALYHKLGGKAAGFTPMQIEHEGISHWYLRWTVGIKTFYIDPTSTQFTTPVPYAKGKGRGFLTKEPSKRAKELLCDADW